MILNLMKKEYIKFNGFDKSYKNIYLSDIKNNIIL